MKRGCHGLYCSGLLLLTMLGSPWAFADKPGTCNPAPACHQTCPTSGLCEVDIVRNGASINVIVNSFTTDVFCAFKGQRIQWRVVDANSMSFADVRFGTPVVNSPFAVTSIQADTQYPATATIKSTASGCYSFAVTDCPVGSVGPSVNPCGYYDPKVVVNPPSQILRHRPREEPEAYKPEAHKP